MYLRDYKRGCLVTHLWQLKDKYSNWNLSDIISHIKVSELELKEIISSAYTDFYVGFIHVDFSMKCIKSLKCYRDR